MEKKFGKKEAKKVFDKIFNQQCPRCGKLELWPWEEAEGKTYYHCDFCNRDFEKGEHGWYMTRADGKPQFYPKPGPKSKFKTKPLEKDAGMYFEGED